MLEFSRLAQDFVEATSALVSGRTINIMDEKGVIIASTEKERIGTFHQGAAEVIATGRPVYISKEDLPRYPGAKEGYNMPIFLKDDLIGVVGIFGCGEEVRDVANLLRVYVTQHFSMEMMAQQKNTETEVRNQLLRIMLLGDGDQEGVISQLSGILSLQLMFPVRVIVLRAPESETPQSHLGRFEPLFQNLIWQGALDRKLDVFGIQKKDYVIIHSLRKSEDAERESMKRIQEAMLLEKGYRMAASCSCECLSAIPEGMKEANTLLSICGESVCLMEETELEIRYLMHKTLLAGGKRKARELYRQLYDCQEEKQADILLETARVYYEENGSVQRASERLHVHKNTLLYRMKRLYMLLNLETDTPFAKEFFIRLILLCHPKQEKEQFGKEI